MIVSRYKIEVKDEPEFAGETFEQRKARILAAKAGLTPPGPHTSRGLYACQRSRFGRLRGLVIARPAH
jgi:hypothetical protein